MAMFHRFNLALTLLAVLSPLSALAVESESGMVTQVQGNVTYTSAGKKEKPVVAFMKARAGDKLIVAKDAKVQLVYFQGGRQEVWRGLAQLEVGSSESRSASQPEVKQLPAQVLQQLTRAPSVVTDLKSRVGMVFVRALPAGEKLRELNDTYASMRKETAADDVTPELYLLSGLHELKLYRDMKPVLEEMRQRQPDNAEVKAVYEQYSTVMSRSKP